MSDWVRGHWEIKVLAMIMAVTLYFYTVRQNRVEVELTVVVTAATVTDLPADRVVSDISPGEFKVVVEGPLDLLSDAESVPITPRLLFDDTRISEGQAAYDVTERVLQLSPQVRLKSTQANRITATIDRIQRRAVPVTVATRDVDLNVDGLVVTAAKADQDQVMVEGPSRVLDARLQGSLPLEPITLPAIDSKLAAPEERSVPVTPDERKLAGLKVLSDDLTATITIAPAPVEREIKVPVHLLVAPGFDVRFRPELHDPEVALRLRGPQRLLAELKVDETITVYVRLPAVPKLDLTLEYPVLINAPDWLHVESDRVQVTVRRRKTAAESPSEHHPIGPDNGDPPVGP